MKQHKVEHKKSQAKPTIINEKIPRSLASAVPINPDSANQPVRAVTFVEVGEMDPIQIRALLQEVNRGYSTARGGIHYVIPIKNGKIGNDVLFEQEWERIVNETCEVGPDGNIRLKGGAKETLVIRERI